MIRNSKEDQDIAELGGRGSPMAESALFGPGSAEVGLCESSFFMPAAGPAPPCMARLSVAAAEGLALGKRGLETASSGSAVAGGGSALCSSGMLQIRRGSQVHPKGFHDAQQWFLWPKEGVPSILLGCYKRVGVFWYL